MSKSQMNATVVGIDVGASRKGFHAVALTGRQFRTFQSDDPAEVLDWCVGLGAVVVAVDAPCGWSCTGRTRLSERELRVGGQKINCFSTPTREAAVSHTKGFYGWVFSGERLYSELARAFPLYSGGQPTLPACIETFPHAIVCSLAGKAQPAKPKAQTRRAILTRLGYDTAMLRNVDFLDAALCSIAADAFACGRFFGFGACDEGIIVVPRTICQP